MSKDQWIADFERIVEDFSSGMLDRDTARGRLISMGYDKKEAEEILAEALE